jgi:hypothetical protein
VFYDFRVNRSRDGPEEMLASYGGYLQADGYAVYTSLVSDSAGRLIDVARWADGRRGFEQALHTTSDLVVHEALVCIQQLYDLENRAREFSVGERQALREAEVVPILEPMKARFFEVRPTLRPKSKLAAAVTCSSEARRGADGGDAPHAGTECPPELRGRMAVPDGRATPPAGDPAHRHRGSGDAAA